MAIQNAAKGSQKGGVLLELLISSFLSIGVIGSVTVLLVSSLRVGTNRAHKLMLAESVASVVQQIKQDIQRAGYGAGKGVRATLAGMVDTVYADKDILGYRYWVQEEHAYRHVVFKWQQTASGQLLICEKMSLSALTPEQAKRSGVLGNCFNLFDPRQIGVSEFEVAVTPYSESSMSRRFISMSLSSHLVSNPKIEYSVNAVFFIRNGE